jgi:purine-nucleoside phosphorylase
MKKASLADRLAYAVAWIHGRTDLRPRAAVVLGSGLGAFTGRLVGPVSVPYEEIPGFPITRVEGHAGRLVLGELPAQGAPGGTVPVAAMQGRVHFYEGWSPDDVVFPVRVLGRLGIRALVLTNAAGGVNPEYAAGDLVRIVDHLNLTGRNPLVGPNDEATGPRFPDMTRVWDPGLGAVVEEEAARLGIGLREGVYAGVTGPSYETPAEVRMLRTLGADLVGMSTVLEAIAARHMGVALAGLSLVANRAAGLSPVPLAHADVQRVAEQAGERAGALLAAVLGRVAR